MFIDEEINLLNAQKYGESSQKKSTGKITDLPTFYFNNKKKFRY